MKHQSLAPNLAAIRNTWLFQTSFWGIFQYRHVLLSRRWVHITQPSSCICSICGWHVCTCSKLCKSLVAEPRLARSALEMQGFCKPIWGHMSETHE